MSKTLDISNYDIDRSSNISLKYHRFTTSGFKDIEIGKFKFVSTTLFLYIFIIKIILNYLGSVS